MMLPISLSEFAEIDAPKFPHLAEQLEFLADVVEEYVENWQDGDYPLIYRQDYQNIPQVHRGMKSSAFKGLRPSPIQERAVAHHHVPRGGL